MRNQLTFQILNYNGMYDHNGCIFYLKNKSKKRSRQHSTSDAECSINKSNDRIRSSIEQHITFEIVLEISLSYYQKSRPSNRIITHNYSIITQ